MTRIQKILFDGHCTNLVYSKFKEYNDQAVLKVWDIRPESPKMHPRNEFCLQQLSEEIGCFEVLTVSIVQLNEL